VEPLWNDISEKAGLRSNGETPTPHFLGAIVLEPQPRLGLRGWRPITSSMGNSADDTPVFPGRLSVAIAELNLSPWRR